MATLCGLAVQQHRQQAEQPLREHVAGVRRVDFAVDGERSRAGEAAGR